MIKDLLLGVSYFFRGLRLISQPGVRRYVVIPLGINTFLFILAIVYGWTRLGQWRGS